MKIPYSKAGGRESGCPLRLDRGRTAG